MVGAPVWRRRGSRRGPEQEPDGLLEPPGAVEPGDEGGEDRPLRGASLTRKRAHRCDLREVSITDATAASRWPVVGVGGRAGPRRCTGSRTWPADLRLRSDGASEARFPGVDRPSGPPRETPGPRPDAAHETTLRRLGPLPRRDDRPIGVAKRDATDPARDRGLAAARCLQREP